MNQNYNHRIIKFLILSSLSWGDLFGWQDVKGQSLTSQHSLSLLPVVSVCLSVPLCLFVSVCLPLSLSLSLSLSVFVSVSLSLSVQHNCNSTSTFNKQEPWIEEGDYFASDLQMARLPWSPRGKQLRKEHVCKITSSVSQQWDKPAAG